MKKVVIILVGIFILSCSSNDDIINMTDNNEQNNVSKIIATTYLLNEPETIIKKSYLDNRPIADTIYSTTNDLWIYISYTYDSNNRLINWQTTYNTNAFIEDFNVEYDDIGRITETNYQKDSYSSITNYLFDGDLIYSENITNGNISLKTFNLNIDGIIYKELNSSGVTEIEYDSNYNVLQITSPDFITSYTYNENITAPNDFQFFENFMFGNYKNNTILYSNNINRAIFSDISTLFKYHSSVTNESLLSNTINTDNSPISRRTYTENGQLSFTFEYFY